jgi:predicted dehydrogenase
VNNHYTVGIVGAGDVAALHARALADLDAATLVAAARRSEAPGRAFADTHDCAWYPDAASLLDEAAPDVVTIATPSGAHLAPTVAAAERGVHVLCEKPLEITTDRIDRMVEAADAHDGKLGGIFQRRYSGVLRAVRDAVADGRFGTLAVASAAVPWWRDDNYYEGTWKGTAALDGGGALMNQSIHAVDALAWLVRTSLGLEAGANPVATVHAHTDVRGHDPNHVEVEDTAVATLRFRDGTLGTLLGATSLYPGTRRRLRIAGREGTAEVHGDELVCWRLREERPEDEALRARHGNSGDAEGAADPMAIDYEKHRRNIEAFLRWVDHDAPFALPAAEARTAVEIIEALYASARREAPVAVAA